MMKMNLAARLLMMSCLCLTMFSPFAMALDNSAFSGIEPVLYYNPSTSQSTPFFPISWYTFGPASNDTINAIAAAGANTVSFADLGEQSSTWHFSATQSALTHANQIGMKIIVGFHPDVLRNVNYNDPSTWTTLQNWVEGLKDYPAVLGWLLGDELSSGGLSAQVVVDCARVVKYFDPNHQVWQCHATGVSDSTIAQYMQYSDVYSLDYYQYFDSTPSFGGANALITVNYDCGVRVANYNWAGNVNIVQAVGPDQAGDLNIFRFPSLGEYRLNVFAALAAAGARGTVNWIYCIETWYSNPNMFYNFRDQTVSVVNGEQRKIAHAMETGWNVGTVSLPTGTIGNHKRLSNILLYDDWTGKYYFIVTNNGSTSQNFTATMSNLPTALRNLTVNYFNSSTTLTLSDQGSDTYQLSDTIAGYGVYLYEFKDYDYGCYNGKLNGSRGWRLTGSNGYWHSTWTQDSGTGSLVLWDNGWCQESAKWSQSMGVKKNTAYTLTWYAAPGGTGGGYFKYNIVNKNGTTIQSAGPVQVNNGQYQWVPYSTTFNSGDSEVVTVNFISQSYDCVAIDNVELGAQEIYNQTINTAEGWKATGTTTAYLSTMSKDSDGSGCLKLWDASWGTGSGKWSQPVGVIPNKNYTLRWFSAPGGTGGGYFKYSITGTSGSTIQSGGPYNVDVPQYQWKEYIFTFNSGNNNLVYVNFISESYDWIAFDNILLVPHALVNGTINTTFRWLPTGTALVGSGSKDADGSTCIYLYDSTWGTGSGKWSQWVGVSRNTSYTLNWFACPGGAGGGYYKYSITDKNGNTIKISNALFVNGQYQWTAVSDSFNSGNNDLIKVNFISHSSDWVAFDNISITGL